MSVSYNGLVNSNINPVDLVKLIQRTYGGHDFSIHFTSQSGMFKINFKENYTPAQMAMRPWERSADATNRLMYVWIDGECASDYQDVTQDPMTYVSLGDTGDARQIINSLIDSQGGYVKDETVVGDTNGEWVRLDAAVAARAAQV